MFNIYFLSRQLATGVYHPQLSIFDECTPVIHEFDLIARVLARLYQEQYYKMSESRDWTSIVSPSKQPLLANQLINQLIAS